MTRSLLPALFLAFALLASPTVAASIYERGNSADPVTLDPQKASTAAEANILRDLYEGLTTYDGAGRVIPGAAARWRVSDDGLTWTFTLRGAKWSNGDAVSAEDFVRSFRRLLDPATGAPDAPLFVAIANAASVRAGSARIETLGVTATGPRTLEIRLERPMAYLPVLLARPSAMPVHRTSLAAGTGPDPRLVVNGPYRISRFVPGNLLRLLRNPEYRDAADVAISTVIYRPYDQSRAMAAFEKGDLLSNNDAQIFRLDAVREKLGEQLRLGPYLGSYFYVAATDRPPLSDGRVRRALAMAVDRQNLDDDVWGGSMLPAANIVPAGLPDYGEPAMADLGPDKPDQRLAAAQALLAEAGYGPEKPLALTIRIAASELNRQAAAGIIGDWAALRVQATVIEAPPAEHYKALAEANDFDLGSVAWIGDFGDPASFLDLFVSGNEALNFSRYANPVFDNLIGDAGRTGDPASRAALLHRADEALMRDLPAIPLLQYGSVHLVSPRLKGWEDNALNVHPSRWLTIEDPPAKED